MVHILDKKETDLKLMSMLYNLLSTKENKLFLLADSPYSTKNWDEIIDRALYWFSEVHLIVGKPWYLRLQKYDRFDSVSVRIEREKNKIFSQTTTPYLTQPNLLKTYTTLIGEFNNPMKYIQKMNIDEVSNQYPFHITETLMDSNLQIYPNMKSRLGDL